jgi:hypothetical protein
VEEKILDDAGDGDGGQQILDGIIFGGGWHLLVLRIDAKELQLQVRDPSGLWLDIARFPRIEYPGDPVLVRIGKMSPGSRNEDFGEPGPAGTCALRSLRVLGGVPE